MNRLFHFVAALFAAQPDSPARPVAQGADDLLREKIAKWNDQAREFDALGCPQLARDFRESARAHERQLALRQFGRKAA